MSTATELWKKWEGLVVDGKFPLRQWLGGSDHSAVFLTELPGLASSKAAIKLIASDGAEADRQISRGRAAVHLSHPNLIRIYDAGRFRLDSTPLLYVVMEYAEEDPSQILPQRPLVPGEAADMLPPLLDALSYVHSKQFVHSRIRPSNVLAVGNQLKLSGDQVVAAAEMNSARKRSDAYDAPEMGAGIVSPVGDVWSIGVTLVTALTQNASFAEGTSSDDPNLPAAVPEPFRGIARECLHLDPKRRCSIAEIQKRLQPAGRSVPAASPPAPSPRTPIKRGPIAALLIIAALIALGVFFSRGKSGTVPAATQQTAPPPSPQTAPPPKPEAAVRAPTVARKKPVAAQGEVVHEVIPDVS